MHRDIYRLRENVYRFAQEKIISMLENEKILEIGPMQIENFSFPEFFIDMRKELTKNNNEYFACDIEKRDGIDVVINAIHLLDHFAERTFDSIIALEVLEHISEPFIMPEIFYILLKPKGKIYISTPFYFLWHDPRPDYWRFSEDGLRYLFTGLFDIEIKPLLHFGDDGRTPIHHTLVGIKK